MNSNSGHTKLWIGIIAAVVILGVIRIMLPSIMLRYANSQMADMEGYQGQVEDLSLSILGGKTAIAGITVKKAGADSPVSFVEIPRVEAVFDWSEIFQGAIVSKVYIYDMQLNFVKGPTKETSQTEIPPSWIELTRKTGPFSVDFLSMDNTGIYFRDTSTEPPIDMRLDGLFITATNLANSSKIAEAKFARVNIYNRPGAGDPDLKAEVLLDTFAQAPTMDMNFQLRNFQLKRLNDFSGPTATLMSRPGPSGSWPSSARQKGPIRAMSNPSSGI